MKQKNIYFYTNLLAWGIVLLLAGNYVFGWVTPTLDPPEGDLSAPLDISSTAQTKTGNLTIDSLLKVGRYSSAPTGATGSLYYDTTDNEFKGYATSSWDSLGGTAPVSSVFGRTGNVTAASGDYSVGNITGAAPLASPTFTGTVTVPTPTADTDAATKAYVDAAGGATIYEVCCAWRYDYREGVVGTGEATNWSCTPAACYSGYTSLGISTIPSGVSCSGGADCNFDSTHNYSHPVSVGRSCRLCAL